MAAKYNVLIVGSVPQPTGGVSVHIQRFLEYTADSDKFNLKCFDVRKRGMYSACGRVGGVLDAIRFFISCDLVHLHVSNSAVKLILALLARFLFKKVVYTHHNSVVSSRNVFSCMFHLSHRVILVNDEDIERRVLQGKTYSLIPAFIPPTKIGELDPELESELSRFNKVVSTNCSSGQFINGKHVYGFDLILEAVSYLYRKNKLDGTVFVLVDPAASCANLISDYLKKYPFIADFIIYIGRPVDFSSLIKKSDATIRATRTDGDSISVRESLFFNVPVVVSDISVRPSGVIYFNIDSPSDLANQVFEATKLPCADRKVQRNYADNIIKVYKDLL